MSYEFFDNFPQVETEDGLHGDLKAAFQAFTAAWRRCAGLIPPEQAIILSLSLSSILLTQWRRAQRRLPGQGEFDL